ncbi:hypothetical protein EIP91_004271 [Steccherinum ochraceum]|uniref:Uncharacterized protein n=1 Tax=Steccherinum ochraceum TaxID=92696 RepID=A0A4R0RC64_9APHY|nr:hypothetical protein EIP91_004271 [Steccherinum ochraceum]
MPTPGRFRSKTSDLSEFIRGSSSKQSSETHLIAGAGASPSQIPPVPTTPPVKTRRKLTFLGRRRKSVSPSPSSSSQTAGEPSGIPKPSHDVPPLPEISSRLTSESLARPPGRTSTSTSLPPVIPPPNVSPSSFGSLTFSSTSTSKPAPDVAQTPDVGGRTSRTLRPQKSTSFEYTRRASVSQQQTQQQTKGGRPVITVSPPRVVKDDTAATVPPTTPPARASSSWKAPRSLRRPMILPFSKQKEEHEKPIPTSPVTETPPLPPSMHFPLPPNTQPQPTSQLAKAMQEDVRTRRGTMTSASGRSVGVTSPTGSTFSETSRRVSRASRESGSRDQDQLSPTSASAIRSLAAEELPTQTPTPRTPSRLSISTAGHAALASSASRRSPITSTGTTPTPTHSRLAFRRGSRSPSPAGTPPTVPLPSLPPEASVQQTQTQTQHENASPRSPNVANRVSMPPPSSYPGSAASVSVPSPPMGVGSGSVPTIPSLPSITSTSPRSGVGAGGAPLRQQVLRPRANTIPISPSSPASVAQKSPTQTMLSSIPEMGKPKEKEKDVQPDSSPPSRGSSISRSGPPGGRRGSVSTTTSIGPGTPPVAYTPPPRSITDSPLYGDIMSLRATHEEYIRSIRETHAMEKAELMRRIDSLEREARKREREVKGLRWLVMNASSAGGVAGGGEGARTAVSLSAAETQGQGRFRSGSKSSQVSLASNASSGLSSSHRRELSGSALQAALHSHSPRTSTEEGLYELQSTIADLIAPNATTPLMDGHRSKPSLSPSPLGHSARLFDKASPPTPPPTSAALTRLRRSNTLPDGVSPLPTVSKPSPISTSKSARRTSSPVLPPNTPPAPPPPTGLGIQNVDIPSIPTASSFSSYNRLSTTDTTLSVASTIPSLTSNVSTASSSALSAIPESSHTNPHPNLNAKDKDREKEERDARRASRVLKRLSASSTTASVDSGTAYHHNLKLGSTPSIAQMLDLDKTVAEASMDDVLKKLRAFGGTGDH